MSKGHERFKEQLSAYSLGALDPTERDDLEHHLEGCDECQAELAWLDPATELLSADVEQIEPASDLKARVMAVVEADLAENPAEPIDEKPGERGSPTRRRRSRRLTDLLRPAVLATVATALVAGVTIGVLVTGSDSPTSPERQVITGQSTIGASAVMVASDGTGTLKMTGLEPTEEGQVYQAWIQRGQSVVPTDALFLPDRGGSATASIPDISEVSAVMVSVEPRGGSEQPTSAPVITVSMPG